MLFYNYSLFSLILSSSPTLLNAFLAEKNKNIYSHYEGVELGVVKILVGAFASKGILYTFVLTNTVM